MSQQLSLLDGDNSDPELPPGLIYKPDFITPEREAGLLQIIDDSPWMNDLLRRVQHYGYKYNYKARRIDKSMRLGDLPEWVDTIAKEVFVFVKNHSELPTTIAEEVQPFDQAIINEYEPGQGISAHIDCEPCFGPVITTLSLGSDAHMRFDNITTGSWLPVPLAQRSLAILTDDARYQWTHSIPNRKTDRWPEKVGPKVERQRRISITFRSIIEQS